MKKSPPDSYAALLQEARQILAGPRYPSFEPHELLSRATGKPRSWFLGNRDERASLEEKTRFGELVARRLAGEPLQYLLGEWEFLGRTFHVDPRALIPRRETEAIVEMAREEAPSARRILDAGTGNGILGITLALERPASRVVALDSSVAALAVAAENARLFGVTDRVFLLASDWVTALTGDRPGALLFDLAVANPPYVPLADAPHLDKTVSEHEPELALYGGADGLEPLRHLLGALPPLLSEGAPFVFEFGYGQAKAVSSLFDGPTGFRLSSIRLDAAGIPRVALAIRARE